MESGQSPYTAPRAAPLPEEEILWRQERDALVLRLLVVLKVAVLVTGIIFSPPSSAATEPPTVLTWIGAGLAILAMVSWVALLMLTRWSAWLYTIAYLGMMSFGFAFLNSTPSVSNLSDWLGTGLSFSIIAMAHFSCALAKPIDPD